MTDIAKLAIQAETVGVTKANAELDKLSKSAGKAETSTKKMTKQSGDAEKASNSFGGATRNLSFQLNQVAQQGAVTGNYLGALAIQLPDMLLSFGTLGILVGAAAGVMAGPLLTALSSSESGTEDLADRIRELTNNLEDATYAQLQFVRAQNSDKIKEQKDAVDEAKKKLSEYGKEMDVLLAKTGGIGLRASELNSLMDEQQAIIDTARQEIKKYNDEASDPRGNAVASRVKEITDGLVDQIAVLTLNKAALLERDLIANNANKTQIESALHLQTSIEKIEAETKALKDQEAARAALAGQLATVEAQVADPNQSVINAAVRRAEIIQRAAEADLDNQAKYDALRVANAEKLSADLIAIEQKTQAQNNKIMSDGQATALSATGQIFGNMAALAKEGGKKQFDEYKAFASAQAIISAALAINNALAVPVVGPALAVTIGALAAVQVAQIQNQSYQGARAMGGQVNSGNSYLVGENGPEIVHMNGNGSVQANHNIAKSSPQITNVFQISAGVQGTVQAEIMAAVPLMKQAALSAYNEASRKGQLRR